MRIYVFKEGKPCGTTLVRKGLITNVGVITRFTAHSISTFQGTFKQSDKVYIVHDDLPATAPFYPLVQP